MIGNGAMCDDANRLQLATVLLCFLLLPFAVETLPVIVGAQPFFSMRF
jgi:hypothetical protein